MCTVISYLIFCEVLLGLMLRTLAHFGHCFFAHIAILSCIIFITPYNGKLCWESPGIEGPFETAVGCMPML